MMMNKNDDMLLFCAMADATAVAVEYDDSAERLEQALRFDRYYAHPKFGDGTPGRYTDDTEMSLANAGVLVSNAELYSLSKRDFAIAYYRHFLSGGRRKGYSKGLQSLFESVRTSEEFYNRLQPYSNKNGAAMRSAPLGAIPHINDVIRLSVIQASATHDTPQGRISAVAVALLSHFTLYTDWAFDEVCENVVRAIKMSGVGFMDPSFLLEPWDESERVKHTSDKPVSIATVQAVAHFLRTEVGLMGTLTRIMKTGGDTDTVAAIVWSILSSRCSTEEKMAIPQYMRNDLEPGSGGRAACFLELAGAMLMKRFSSKHSI